MTITNTL